jgi:hypothetical protein
VKQYQVVQREPDALLVRLVLDPECDVSVHEAIRDGIRKLAGDGVRIEFEAVDAIALTASGKRRVTICELPA